MLIRVHGQQPQASGIVPSNRLLHNNPKASSEQFIAVRVDILTCRGWLDDLNSWEDKKYIFMMTEKGVKKLPYPAQGYAQ